MRQAREKLWTFVTAVRKEGLVSAVSRTASYCARRGMLVLASSLDSGDPLSEHPQARTLLIESCVNPSSDRRCPSDAWGLGDAIFRLPAVEALRRTGGRHVDVVTAHGREAVFRRSPDVGTVMTPADGWLSLARRIRRGGYTHVFAMHPSWRMLLLGLIAWARNIRTAYFDRDIYLHGNHIDMSVEAVRRMAPDLAEAEPRPYMLRERGNLLPRDGYHIGLNIGASSSLRHFKDWESVLERVRDEVPEWVRFVLVGRGNTQWVDSILVERFPSLVASFVDSLDLEDTYRLIAECDAFVGADGGNVNAAIALMRENVFPIFGLADPGSRLPADFPPDDVIRGRCPLAEHGCFAKMTPQDTRCEVTGQTDGEHSRTTPCMSDALVVDEIVVRLRRVFEQVRTARPRRAVA